MKRTFGRILATLMTLFMIVSFGACSSSSGGDNIIDDEKTLNVKIRKAGYGTTYIDALAQQFEQTFAVEGYKINVLPAREDLTADNVYRDIYSQSGIDVYFASDLDAQKAVAGDYEVTLADITESVYNKKAIKFDKTEEDSTILEKVSGYYIGEAVYNNKYYAAPYAASIGGIAVNKRVLSEYKLELPRTTNELIKCGDEIMKQATSTDVYPFTFALSGNNYVVGSFTTWFAQYSGLEEYNKFMSFTDAQGNTLPNFYEVFEYDGLEKALEIVYHLYDPMTAAIGAANQEFSVAQSQIMKGDAAFMCNGDWMLNEEYDRFTKLVDDVTFIKPPMISALGEKLFGAGTNYGFDSDKCDKILSTIVKYADQNKLAEEIKPLVDTELHVNIELADVQTVCERRGYVRLNLNFGLVVSEHSTKKELAATFIRFCCSEEAGKLFSTKSRSSSPWALDDPVESDIEWIKSVNGILANPYGKQIISNMQAKRKQLSITYLPKLGEYFATTIFEQGVSKYNEYLEIVGDNKVYATAARNAIEDEYQNARKQEENGAWK